MNYYLGFPLFLTVALFQSAAMPYLSPLGVTPNILLVTAACWAMLGGQKQTMLLVPISALFLDLLTLDPVGASVIVLAPIVLLAGLREELSEGRFLLTVLLVASGTLAARVLDGIIMLSIGESVNWGEAIFRRWLPAMAINGVITPAFYLPLALLNGGLKTGTASLQWRRG